MAKSDFNWDATSFFRELTAKNKLAKQNGFTFCEVSSLQGFEEVLQNAQASTAFVCVSDLSDGYTSLTNTPHTRRIKTVFLAMRHAAEDMQQRGICLGIMRELFRQFMTIYIKQATILEQDRIYPDMRINFKEIDQYFFTGCACAYFQLALDTQTDLQFNAEEWDD